MQKIDKHIIIAGLICLTLIQLAAFYFKIDGTLRSFIILIIAAAVGVTIPREKIMQEGGIHVRTKRK